MDAQPVKLALLKGSRFNPWHLQAFGRMPGVQVTAFRADPVEHRAFHEHTEAEPPFAVEDIWYDTQAGSLPRRVGNALRTQFLGRPSRILPFFERLRDFDIIQTWELFTDWSEQALEAKRRWGIPVSVMVWDTIPFNMEREPRRRALKERVAREADRFLVHTERSRRMLDIDGVDPSRVVKVDPGVDTATFSPGPGVRRELGLLEEAFVILFAGWLLPRQGIDFLLLALRELLRDASLDRPVELLVVGSGPGRDRVERLAERLGVAGRCVFAGALPYGRMPDVFRSADLFALPSTVMPDWQEQFSMALIEAMSCGVPVVTTYSGAIPEIVEDAAKLCQPNDFLSLYETIRLLVDDRDQRRMYAERGRRLALRRDGLARYAGVLLASCMETLARGGPLRLPGTDD
jgi:glycosyltransferase involved in cell wall biosynthesis